MLTRRSRSDLLDMLPRAGASSAPPTMAAGWRWPAPPRRGYKIPSRKTSAISRSRVSTALRMMLGHRRSGSVEAVAGSVRCEQVGSAELASSISEIRRAQADTMCRSESAWSAAPTTPASSAGGR